MLYCQDRRCNVVIVCSPIDEAWVLGSTVQQDLILWFILNGNVLISIVCHLWKPFLHLQNLLNILYYSTCIFNEFLGFQSIYGRLLSWNHWVRLFVHSLHIIDSTFTQFKRSTVWRRMIKYYLIDYVFLYWLHFLIIIVVYISIRNLIFILMLALLEDESLCLSASLLMDAGLKRIFLLRVECLQEVRIWLASDFRFGIFV